MISRDTEMMICNSSYVLISIPSLQDSGREPQPLYWLPGKVYYIVVVLSKILIEGLIIIIFCDICQHSREEYFFQFFVLLNLNHAILFAPNNHLLLDLLFLHFHQA